MSHVKRRLGCLLIVTGDDDVWRQLGSERKIVLAFESSPLDTLDTFGIAGI